MLTFSLEVKSSKLKRQVLLGLTQSHMFDTLCHANYMSRTGTSVKTSVVTEVPHTLSTFDKQMRFEVLAAVNTETTLFQPGRQVLAIQDTMTANSVHKFTTRVLNQFIKVQIEPTYADAMRLEGKDHEWH